MPAEAAIPPATTQRREGLIVLYDRCWWPGSFERRGAFAHGEGGPSWGFCRGPSSRQLAPARRTVGRRRRGSWPRPSADRDGDLRRHALAGVLAGVDVSHGHGGGTGHDAARRHLLGSRGTGVVDGEPAGQTSGDGGVAASGVENITARVGRHRDDDRGELLSPTAYVLDAVAHAHCARSGVHGPACAAGSACAAGTSDGPPAGGAHRARPRPASRGGEISPGRGSPDDHCSRRQPREDGFFAEEPHDIPLTSLRGEFRHLCQGMDGVDISPRKLKAANRISSRYRSLVGSRLRGALSASPPGGSGKGLTATWRRGQPAQQIAPDQVSRLHGRTEPVYPVLLRPGQVTVGAEGLEPPTCWL